MKKTKKAKRKVKKNILGYEESDYYAVRRDIGGLAKWSFIVFGVSLMGTFAGMYLWRRWLQQLEEGQVKGQPEGLRGDENLRMISRNGTN